jgi:Fe-Mn family superoxide dismutase
MRGAHFPILNVAVNSDSKSNQYPIKINEVKRYANKSIMKETESTHPSSAKAEFQLPALPYPQDALAPYVSATTMSFHYGKHHQAYVDNLNKLIAGTPSAGQPLDAIIRESAGVVEKAAVFNNAAQVWNHTFFWKSMKAGGGGMPTGRLLKQIEKSFGSFDEFKMAFVTAAVAQFGSGWAWIVWEGDALRIVKTSNADTPAARGQTALLACDVWEHAYYLDYQNRRKDFVEAFLDHLANWEFAASQLK